MTLQTEALNTFHSACIGDFAPIACHYWFLLSTVSLLLPGTLSCVFLIVIYLSESQYIPYFSSDIPTCVGGCYLLPPSALLHTCLRIYSKFHQCFQLLLLSSSLLRSIGKTSFKNACLCNIVKYYVFHMVSSEAKILVLATLILCVILTADIFTYLPLFLFPS